MTSRETLLDKGDPVLPDSRSERNPYVFVVGCSRSGTTMLQRMLNKHPLLAVVHESHFLPRLVHDPAPGSDVPLTPELLDLVRTDRRIHKFKLPDDWFRTSATQCTSYAGLLCAMYAAFAQSQGKPLAGEKTPAYLLKLPLLHALFPWARTVHLIRDGRDVALSTVEWAADKHLSRYSLWSEEPVGVCALVWERGIRTGQRDGRSLGARHYRELRYEALVASPREELRTLAAFLDLPDAPEMSEYYVGRTRRTPGLSAKKAWLPPTQGLRDWRTQMSPRDTALFEALAGDVLEELGYERSVDSFSPEVAEAAERCRTWWRSRHAGEQPKAPLQLH